MFLLVGVYRISMLSIFGSAMLQGSGNNVTVLRTTNLTVNVITFKSDGWHLRDLQLDAIEERTSGAFVYSAASYASVTNVSVAHQYIGFDLDGSWHVELQNIYAYDGTPHETALGGAVIRLGNRRYTGPINIRGLTAKPTSGNRQPSSGITMENVDVVSISNALTIWHKHNIVISPSGLQFAALTEISNSCFDTSETG